MARRGRSIESGSRFPTSSTLFDLALLWPFWLLTEFLGARWTIVIERGNAEVDPKLVWGWRKSRERVTEIARQVASGEMSGHCMA